jgi:hypothetical protein
MLLRGGDGMRKPDLQSQKAYPVDPWTDNLPAVWISESKLGKDLMLCKGRCFTSHGPDKSNITGWTNKSSSLLGIMYDKWM